MNKDWMKIGTGVLSWPRVERISDRYGFVFLMGQDDASLEIGFIPPPPVTFPPEGTYGQLIAIIEETRQSTHIGDVFRGIFPTTPKVGDEIVLGEGTVQHTRTTGENVVWQTIGLEPADGRYIDWLDPRALLSLPRSDGHTAVSRDEEAVKLAWTVKQWHPGITTYKQAGSGTTVLVGLSGGACRVDSRYLVSHAAAAEWAAEAICASLDLLTGQPINPNPYFGETH